MTNKIILLVLFTSVLLTGCTETNCGYTDCGTKTVKDIEVLECKGVYGCNYKYIMDDDSVLLKNGKPHKMSPDGYICQWKCE